MNYINLNNIFVQIPTFTLANISITTIIIVITVIASIYAEENAYIKSKWLMNPFSIDRRKEYYRFITSGFIHSGYMHLAFNMIALYYFGNTMETVFTSIFGSTGFIMFAFFYVVAIVISDLPTYFKYRNNPAYNSLGASGAVSAIVFAGILFDPLRGIGLLFIPVYLPGFIFGALYLFYTIYMSKNSNDYINHDAHLYGALFGIVVSIVVYPQVITRFIQEISKWQGFF